MLNENKLHYIPGEKSEQDSPLDRFLPPVRSGVVAAWLFDNIPPGSWLIDPFGSSPELIYEAAANGYKVLVSINNPITQFILELRSRPIKEADFQAAIAQIASTQVGAERLEPHIKALYETSCEACGRLIQAEAFLWKRGGATPVGRIYTCPHCGDAGEHPVTPPDVEKASRFLKKGLHYSRALERVTPLHDPDRHHVEDALEVYLPRAIYVLVTLINKLASIPQHDPNHPLLSALLLSAFDRANTLWPYPKARQRPKQLTIPPQFLEHNIWLSLETAANIWAFDAPAVPVTKWPQQPPDHGGICIFEGRIKDLAKNLSNINPEAVVTSFPRPNQAFWTLSALWSGWLWGHQALEQFKSVLRRRRYDWSWHITAIRSSINNLLLSLPTGTPCFGLVNEVEPGFLSAVILGSQLANLVLTGIAQREEDAQAQISWKTGSADIPVTDKTTRFEERIIRSTSAYLKKRGEPCPYSYLHTAGLVDLASDSPSQEITTPGEYLSQVHAALQTGLTYRHGYLRYGGSEKSLEVGSWWHRSVSGEIMPLSDEIEVCFLDYLVDNPGKTFQEIDTAICNRLNGLLPPNTNLLRECLQSYGQKQIHNPNQWTIGMGEHSEQRHEDMVGICQCLVDLGQRLNFQVLVTQDANRVTWSLTEQQEKYVFHISTSAHLSKYLSNPPTNHQKGFIVIPGSRANLIAYKLEQNPYLNQLFESQWSFIKFRLVRQLAEHDNISVDNLDELLSVDPITYMTFQMRMF